MRDWLTMAATWTIERLFHMGCDTVKTETNSRLISRGRTSLVVILRVLLVVLKHWQIICMCCIFKSTNYGFLDGEFLNWIWRICCETQLSYLRRVPVLRVWVVWSSGLLRTEFVIAFNDYSAKFKRSIFIRGLNIYEQPRSTRIIDAWFIIGGSLSLFCRAATRVMENLQASLACRRLFAVTKALLRSWLRLGAGHGLSLALLLCFLIWEAFVVSRFKLLVQAFDCR
jgi:hypothetical protein